MLKSLDPLSVQEHLAFYKLYPDTAEGKQALNLAWQLLKGSSESIQALDLPPIDISQITSLVTNRSPEETITLSDSQLKAVELLGKSLHNRSLPGHNVWNCNTIRLLKPDEIDLSRALLLEQFRNHPNPKNSVRQYEAVIDIMALQIAARLSEKSTPEEKIRQINRFVFQEMGFRFPPHSLYAKNIDEYTFLPSVLDGRMGVCLGVSILYLSLAQRLDLDLEIVTPPGHIYVRYRDGNKEINIETTARGLETTSEMYLGVNTRALQTRNIKEVVGMAFFNQASVAWQQEKYEDTVALYEKAAEYISDDPLLQMFLGMNYLFVGKKNAGKKLLQAASKKLPDHVVVADTLPVDYLDGKASIQAIKTVFLPVDSTKKSILEKQKALKKVVKKHPKFRMGMMQLATTWLQLRRTSEARAVLEKYHKIDPSDPTVEYYLSEICREHADYNQAWLHLHNAEEIVRKREHHPKALKYAYLQLRTLAPNASF